jgi:hypothetical protein
MFDLAARDRRNVQYHLKFQSRLYRHSGVARRQNRFRFPAHQTDLAMCNEARSRPPGVAENDHYRQRMPTTTR